ncbi:hypothetical protein [Cecembia rubra]|uniref:DUF3052 family protein n=1 Tax=Cecembia rubra TaxID=1485585 RepID=A0A2P8DPY2_9BACT|nr:hypothetical protein [Cecembia rubra]PSK99273.1 hypothetical protein CLV48_11759 [Cecembia rubra]
MRRWISKGGFRKRKDAKGLKGCSVKAQGETLRTRKNSRIPEVRRADLEGDSIQVNRKSMITPLFKKLNFKAHSHILVLNSPSSFQREMEQMASETPILKSLQNIERLHFILVFVKTLHEIEDSIADIYHKLEGDAILWYCYPKASSKRYTCEFNRDTGWSALGKFNLEGVRQVAIDEDWSAIRFRKLEFIKNMTRRDSMKLSGREGT